jgi:hypothetical protein
MGAKNGGKITHFIRRNRSFYLSGGTDFYVLEPQDFRSYDTDHNDMEGMRIKVICKANHLRGMR